jgi:hypothetical protein
VSSSSGDLWSRSYRTVVRAAFLRGVSVQRGSGLPVSWPGTLPSAIHGLRSLGEICASPSGLRWLSTPGSMTRAAPSRMSPFSHAARALPAACEALGSVRSDAPHRKTHGTREPGCASGGRRPAKAAGGKDAPPAVKKEVRSAAGGPPKVAGGMDAPATVKLDGPAGANL